MNEGSESWISNLKNLSFKSLFGVVVLGRLVSISATDYSSFITNPFFYIALDSDSYICDFLEPCTINL